MCNKTVDNYFHALEFVLSSYKNQRMFNKAVDISPEGQNMIDTFVFLLLIDKRIMCNEVVLKIPLY